VPADGARTAERRPGLDGLIGRFARLLVDSPELIAVEIDPLIVGPAGPVAVDARVRWGDGARPWS
jgi:hypothetical protein